MPAELKPRLANPRDTVEKVAPGASMYLTTSVNISVSLSKATQFLDLAWMLDPFSHEQSLLGDLIARRKLRKHVPRTDRAGNVEALLRKGAEAGEGHCEDLHVVILLCRR